MAISAPSPRRWPRRSTRCARRPRSSRACGRRRPIASRVSTSWPSSWPNSIARRRPPVKTTSSPRSARCSPTPSGWSGSVRRATRRCTSATMPSSPPSGRCGGARRDTLRREGADLSAGEDHLRDLERRFATARGAYAEAAAALSSARGGAADRFARELEQRLAELAMDQTRVEVRFQAPLPPEQGSAGGVDRGEFYLSPNPGEELRPLARIVSGGELSRVMLAIKSLTATTRHGFVDAALRPPGAAPPGLIFDEVDAGIGGRVADVVGRRLRALGSAFQVLCITHLPQIAAYADTHFQIAKRVDRGRTRTTVVRLDETARVEELARMLGGEAITDGLRSSAREMLKNRKAGAKGERAKGESLVRRSPV